MNAIRCLLACLLLSASAYAVEADVSIHYSPDGGCTAEVVAQIEAARKTVLVQAYSFTSLPIAEALLAAHRRGVAVQVIVDRGQPTAKGGQAGRLASAGVPVLVDARHAIAHQKTMVIDRQVVLAGSFNFTASAEARNSECLYTIRSADIATQQAENWREHAEHSGEWTSTRYEARSTKRKTTVR